jgi:hypothetical protein
VKKFPHKNETRTFYLLEVGEHCTSHSDGLSSSQFTLSICIIGASPDKIRTRAAGWLRFEVLLRDAEQEETGIGKEDMELQLFATSYAHDTALSQLCLEWLIPSCKALFTRMRKELQRYIAS